MAAAQNLAIFFLSCQLLASVFLVIGLVFDRGTFEKLGLLKRAWMPRFVKVVHLLRNTEKPLMMGVYFLSLIYIVLSFAGLILLVIQLFRYFL